MKRVLLLFLTVFMVVVWYFALFGEKGIIKIIQLRHERDRIMSEVRRIRGENEKLTREIRRLREDPAYLESVVRQELGVVKENEIIFIFEDDKVEKKWDEK